MDATGTRREWPGEAEGLTRVGEGAREAVAPQVEREFVTDCDEEQAQMLGGFCCPSGRG